MLVNSSHSMGKSVGVRLRQARVAKQMTQNQLARPDFSVSYISAIERGQIQPSLRALEILARRLDLSTTDLLPAPPGTVSSGTPAEVAHLAPGDEERELAILEARVAIYQGHAARAIELLQAFVPQRHEKRLEGAGELYYVLGWAYLVEGRLQESEQRLAEAARLSKDAPGPLYPCILSLQSAVYKAMHNSEQAIQTQREILRVLVQQSSETDKSIFLAQLHSSVAQHYSAIGETQQASEHFRQTLQVLQGQASLAEKQEHYQALSQEYTKRELYALALLYGYKGLLADWPTRQRELRNEIEYRLGRAWLQFKPDEARTYLQNVAREAEVRHDELALAGANTQLARWLIAHDELAQAEALLHEAQGQIASLEATQVGADIQLLAGELAYKRQDYSTGDTYFEKGLALLEKVGAREEWIEYIARYAQLLEERNCIQKSIYYWKLAYEIRQKNSMLVL